MVITYVFIPTSIVFFDIIDFNGEYREIICYIIIILFIVFYILTVELPAIVFKISVERYDMFSKKYKRNIFSLLANIIIISFFIESIVYIVSIKQIMYYDFFYFLLLIFFRLALRMSSIELNTVKAKLKKQPKHEEHRDRSCVEVE